MVARGSATLPPPTRLLGDADRFAPAPPLSPPLKSAAGRNAARGCDAEKLASGGEIGPPKTRVREQDSDGNVGKNRMRIFLKTVAGERIF
jgi:hypothetical protein